MFTAKVEVLRGGDESGNNMIVRIDLASGRKIYGFATENSYSGEWSLGPTWNYLVTGARPFLLDTGRRGMGSRLLAMMEESGVEGVDLLVLSHGHEDHDGGLRELAGSTGATVAAHKTYRTLIGTYPDSAPSPGKREFPASCWDCGMPASFYERHCLTYHQERRGLSVADIEESRHGLDEGITVVHVPGHSPDAIALRVDEEVVLTGDTILPDITPHPTREEIFQFTRGLLPAQYTAADQLYGLRAYIRSLGRLRQMGPDRADMLALPAHRFFYKGQWNRVGIKARVSSLVEHHLERCSNILSILTGGPKTVDEIAREHFEPRLLAGFGINMAGNEILSHCELLRHSGDVAFGADGTIRKTGDRGYRELIATL